MGPSRRVCAVPVISSYYYCPAASTVLPSAIDVTGPQSGQHQSNQNTNLVMPVADFSLPAEFVKQPQSHDTANIDQQLHCSQSSLTRNSLRTVTSVS